ncbi:MAG: L,D-transpeptidase [Anaerolineae bacterium]|nr:L,D-transpeptidase [Anaerolineae bacterium]
MSLTRRHFLRLAGASLAGLAASRRPAAAGEMPPLGRVTVPRLAVRGGPGAQYPEWGAVGLDDVVYIYGQVEGEALQRFNAAWYNVGAGYAYSSFLQPVIEVYNPVEEVGGGFWGEITLPYTEGREAPNLDAPVLNRLYCYSVFWVRGREDDADGRAWYRLDSRRAARPMFWVPADAVRRVPSSELAPISPNVYDKRITIDLREQWLTAYEGSTPVLGQRISSGMRSLARSAAIDYRTRPGAYNVMQKRPTTHMIGGAPGIDAYDLPGVPWSVFFSYTGLAIHGAYWHNDFGRPRSHGCIHVPPHVARWLYCWTAPHAGYDEDLLVVYSGGTIIEVL